MHEMVSRMESDKPPTSGLVKALYVSLIVIVALLLAFSILFTVACGDESGFSCGG